MINGSRRASKPRVLRATAELQLLRQADPDSGQPLLVALDGHSLRREIWVCFDDGECEFSSVHEYGIEESEES
jgi:hypothetical protein